MPISPKEVAMAKRRRSTSTAAGDRGLGPLIDRIGPINNAGRSAEGIDKVELLWDLGEALLCHDPDASDDLLWTISERSYITRDLLRYALIIRRGWAERAELRRTFPRLAQYTLFREALPFLKGNRREIPEEKYQEILTRLNGRNPDGTKEFLLMLKSEAIGRRHKKGQAVAKMGQVAEMVRSAVRQMLVLATANKLAELRASLGQDALLTLAQLCMAVAEDSTPPGIPDNREKWPAPFAVLGNSLLLVSQANRDERSGFRKALGPVTLMEAADLLNSMRSDEGLSQWKRRRRMDLTL
jgi:hypothetical protein